jgi:hypothetical protein
VLNMIERVSTKYWSAVRSAFLWRDEVNSLLSLHVQPVPSLVPCSNLCSIALLSNQQVLYAYEQNVLTWSRFTLTISCITSGDELFVVSVLAVDADILNSRMEVVTVLTDAERAAQSMRLLEVR